ncbi:hypothetical protein BJX65DRAFT_254409 [Aspergillus insuetus]
MPKQFQCRFPGCNASYARKEHLTRHAAQHVRQQSFTCPTCGNEFGRSDTLRRHIRQNHGISCPISRIRACDSCRALKARCDGGSPCRECSRRQIACSLSGTSPTLAPTSSREEKEKRAIAMYWSDFHPRWPFVHQASFQNYEEGPLLVQSIVAIGLWATGEQSARSAALQLHKVLGSALLEQRDKWECPHLDRVSDFSSWPIPTFQAIVLYILFALISKGTAMIGFDLKPVLPSAEMDLLGSLVTTCRHLGMFHYPTILAQYSNDHVKAYIWIGVEEIKRLNLALFKLCRSIAPSEGRCRLAPTELQFPLPTGERLWSAVTSADWHAEAAKEGSNLDKTRGPDEPWISESAELVRCIDPESGFV